MQDPNDESDPESRHDYLDRIVRQAPTRTDGAFYGSTRRSDSVRTDGGPSTGPQASPGERRRWHAARAAAKRLQRTAPGKTHRARTDGNGGSIRGLEDGDLVEWADQRLQDALDHAENSEARYAIREARQALLGELFDAPDHPTMTAVERDRATAALPVTGPNGRHYGDGAKCVQRGEIALEAREHGPARRLLDVKTRDGWTYRFQRYASCEPWVRYNRERPDGSILTRRAGQLPESVERYRDAVDDGHVTPTLDPSNPPREVDVEITEQVDVVAIDGGRTQETHSHEP